MGMGSKIPEKILVYKTSHRSHLSSYVLAILVSVLFVLLFTTTPYLKQVRMPPTTPAQFISTIIATSFLFLIMFLMQQPTMERFIRQYHITNIEVMKLEGIGSKKRVVIPYQSIAAVKVNKSIIGRILNYGDIEISGFGGNVIAMKGMSNPDVIYKIIENKISQFRAPARPDRKKR